MAFQILWLRKFIRRYTKPMSESYALGWKRKLSLGYMLLAWNAFGFVAYMAYNGRADWAKEFKDPEYMKLSPAQQWAQTLGIKQAKVYRISGLNVHSYEIGDETATPEGAAEE